MKDTSIIYVNKYKKLLYSSQNNQHLLCSNQYFLKVPFFKSTSVNIFFLHDIAIYTPIITTWHHYDPAKMCFYIFTFIPGICFHDFLIFIHTFMDEEEHCFCSHFYSIVFASFNSHVRWLCCMLAFSFILLYSCDVNAFIRSYMKALFAAPLSGWWLLMHFYARSSGWYELLVGITVDMVFYIIIAGREILELFWIYRSFYISTGFLEGDDISEVVSIV